MFPEYTKAVSVTKIVLSHFVPDSPTGAIPTRHSELIYLPFESLTELLIEFLLVIPVPKPSKKIGIHRCWWGVDEPAGHLLIMTYAKENSDYFLIPG